MRIVRLPKEIEIRLDSLAEATGRSKSFHVRRAMLSYLDDMDDHFLAIDRLTEKQSSISLEEMESRLNLSDRAAQKTL